MALLATVAFTSCDDFLTETPKYALTTDNAVRDYNSADNAVTGIYGEYKNCSYLGGYIYEIITYRWRKRRRGGG